MAAIIYRAGKLGRLSDRHARRLRIILSKHGIHEPVSIEPREITPRIIREDKYGGRK